MVARSTDDVHYTGNCVPKTETDVGTIPYSSNVARAQNKQTKNNVICAIYKSGRPIGFELSFFRMINESTQVTKREEAAKGWQP